MKRIIFALMAAAMLCTPAQGKNRTVTENDSHGNKKRVIELRDTVVDGKELTDTLSVMTFEDSAVANTGDDEPRKHHSSAYNFGWNMGNDAKEMVIAVTAIVFVFGFPIFIIFIIFFFRYKNRKAKYRLMEQALASGQPLPETLVREAEKTDIRSNGIKNVFVGIGLFIFLWAITGEFGVGSIGLLVMFTGFGQLVIYYTQQSKDGRPFIHIKNDEKTGSSSIKVGGIEINNQEKDAEK